MASLSNERDASNQPRLSRRSATESGQTLVFGEPVRGQLGRLDPFQVGAVERLLETTSWALGHVYQVRRLAAILFDELHPQHGYGDDEGLLLEAAALLHDVGFPVDPARHHKVSARIIRANLGAPFTPIQAERIALLARYHRKALPSLRHERFRLLSARDQRIIVWLAGILRVADGLDRAHDAAVRSLSVKLEEGRLIIEARGPTLLASSESLDGARAKRNLLEKAIGMPVVLRTQI
jgi:exopolyphosphatase/guanosine-5'-triphosphate,3'-diphosphate pyrophosphatase